MNPKPKFIFHSDTRIHNPNVPGMNELRHAVEKGVSILATQSETRPVLAIQEAQQYLNVQTSGSTGVPKTIHRLPSSWIASFEVNADRFALTTSDVYATFGSLKHSLSIYACLEAFHVGAGLCNLSKLGARAKPVELQNLKATVLYATPTQLRALLKVAKRPLPSIRLVFCGGGKLEQGLKVELQTKCPNATIREFYGASETSFVTMSDDNTPIGSVGHAYPQVEIKVSGQDHNGNGEIWVKSPYLFESYMSGESHDVRWLDGFVNIGEMGRLDKFGNLFLAGRSNRMTTIADINVYPEKIERLILENSEVESCAVVTVSDTMRGARLICFFEGEDKLAKNLKAICRDMLSPHEVPKAFVACDRLPLIPAGKPDLQKLQNRAMKL